MKKDVADFVAKCLICQQLKLSIDDLETKWVVVDRFTKLAHFIPVKMTMSKDMLVQLYMDNMMRLHGTITSIVLDKDVRFLLIDYGKNFKK